MGETLHNRLMDAHMVREAPRGLVREAPCGLMIAAVLGIAISSTETALVELRCRVVRVRVGIVPPTSPPTSPVTSIHPIRPAPSIEVGAAISCAMSIVAIESTAATMRCKAVTTMASTYRIESQLRSPGGNLHRDLSPLA
jgi:hypothetical protein